MHNYTRTLNLMILCNFLDFVRIHLFHIRQQTILEPCDVRTYEGAFRALLGPNFSDWVVITIMFCYLVVVIDSSCIES